MRAKLWPLVAMLWLGSLPTSPAQTFSRDPFETLPEAAAPRDDAESAQLVFRLLIELPLPGPLPEFDAPRATGAGIEIPVAGGLAWLPDRAPTELRIEPGAARTPVARQGELWVETARGKRRFLADGAGWLRAERRCGRCERGWRKSWKLQLAGLAAARPLVVGQRVCVGTLANRVYCLRTRTGHRLWDADLGGRVAEPLVAWSSGDAEATSVRGGRRRAVLVVVERGSEVVALDQRSGVKIAGMRVDGSRGRLLGVPLASADGRIVFARQGYAEADASVLVYRLAPPPTAADVRGAQADATEPP